MPRTKRKQQAQNTDSSLATAPARVTATLPVAPTAAKDVRVDGVSGGAKQKRKRRRKARTEVSDSDSSSRSSSSSDSDDSSAKRKVKSKKQKKRKEEEEEEKEGFETLAGKGIVDGNAEMKDATSVHGASSEEEEEEEEGEGEGDLDEADGTEEGEGGPRKRVGDFSPGKSPRIPSPLLQRDPTDPQSAQRFEEYYMQLITSEFGEELNQVRKAKDFGERSLPMLVRALKLGVNVFDIGEKRTVVRSLGL
ncbi:hypothetical protein L211DRAFT_19310 [Terfezia boudieri ATCC MYA-4762]|uniref:Ribosome assembly protein 3 n=1 Tax=Terfezia boudieri ATCC MYA-4762 TaxID=1051890 RepID=A0A3N4M761_9PEZI|nr:hypothetical protein L211DRAFT_19310 [Terfezia boudieri ATCC MYA-4762]